MTKEDNERLKKLEANQMETLNLVTELKLGLLGSDKLKLKGIAQKVQDHEEYIDKDKKRKYQVAGAVAAISFVFGMVGNYLLKLIFGK